MRINHLANFATVVVLPAPCRPAIKMTAGGWVARLSFPAEIASLDAPPFMIFTNSSRTIPTNACPGVKLETTSSPRAFSLILANNSLMTGNETSASKRARRISRSISAVFSSVSRAWPRMVFTTRLKRSVRFSSMRVLN